MRGANVGREDYSREKEEEYVFFEFVIVVHKSLLPFQRFSVLLHNITQLFLV